MSSRTSAMALALMVIATSAPARAADAAPQPAAIAVNVSGSPGPAAMGPGMMFPMMMGHDHMGGMAHGWSSGIEIRYLPGLPVVTPTTTVAPGTGPASIVGGFDVRTDMGMMGLGAQANVAAQLGAGTGAGTGNWVTPHVGLMPRLGLGLGPLRIEGGLLAGVGLNLRQVAAQNGANALEARGAWVLEPRVEIGLRGDGLAGALVGTYLVSSAPNDLGGLTGGVRVSFGGGKPSSDQQVAPGKKEPAGHTH